MSTKHMMNIPFQEIQQLSILDKKIHLFYSTLADQLKNIEKH